MIWVSQRHWIAAQNTGRAKLHRYLHRYSILNTTIRFHYVKQLTLQGRKKWRKMKVGEERRVGGGVLRGESFTGGVCLK